MAEIAATAFRTYRLRLKPTKAQHAALREALEHSRNLYNAALEERIDCYRKTGKGRTFFDQGKALCRSSYIGRSIVRRSITWAVSSCVLRERRRHEHPS